MKWHEIKEKAEALFNRKAQLNDSGFCTQAGQPDEARQ